MQPRSYIRPDPSPLYDSRAIPPKDFRKTTPLVLNSMFANTNYKFAIVNSVFAKTNYKFAIVNSVFASTNYKIAIVNSTLPLPSQTCNLRNCDLQVMP